MFRRNRPDPYNGFKDDRERRLALNTKVRWSMAAAVATAACGSHVDWIGTLQWLKSFFH